MAIADEIAAIDALNILPESKRRQKYALKAKSLYDTMLPLQRRPYTFNGVTYELWDLRLENEGLTLFFTVKAVATATKTSPEQLLMLPQVPHRFTNPSALTTAYVDDRLTAARELIASVLP